VPRYLAAPCCGSREHCTNLDDKDYASSVLDGLTRVRNQVKSLLLASGLQNFRVMDVINTVLGYKEGGRPKNDIVVPDLKKVAARDGVHFTEIGLKNLASGIEDMVTAVTTKDTLAPSLFQPPRRPTTGEASPPAEAPA